jgi:hypothetical protein
MKPVLRKEIGLDFEFVTKITGFSGNVSEKTATWWFN